MEDIRLGVEQNKVNTYSKINTEEDVELYELNYEKEIPVTDNQFNIRGRRTVNQQEKFCYKKIGNTFCFFGDDMGNPKILIGPHWPLFVCFSSFMFIIYMVLFYFIWRLLNSFLKYSGIINFISFFGSYTYIFLSNPGMPKITENSFFGKPRDKYKYCNECKLWISNAKSTEHCFDCNICIEEHDHHCVWTGKCISQKNKLFFYIFIISILLSFCFFIFSLTYAISKAETNNKKHI
jgi:hypothetical protein